MQHAQTRLRARRGLVAWRFEVGEDEFALLQCSDGADPAAVTERLTNAEREVARLAADGRSNAEIARLRGSALRTVANQLARVFRKLAVSSRFELAARFASIN